MLTCSRAAGSSAGSGTELSPPVLAWPWSASTHGAWLVVKKKTTTVEATTERTTIPTSPSTAARPAQSMIVVDEVWSVWSSVSSPGAGDVSWSSSARSAIGSHLACPGAGQLDDDGVRRRVGGTTRCGGLR